MPKPRKNRNRKNAPAALSPEALTSAMAQAVAQALDPLSRKLDAVLEQSKAENIKVDETTLELVGVEDVQQLGEILEEAAEVAADNLEGEGNPVAAALIDEGLDTEEILTALVKSRKAKKAAGETLETVTVEEVVETIEAIAEDTADNLEDEELQQLVDEGLLDPADADLPKQGEPEDNAGAKQWGKKSAAGTRSRKSASSSRQQANTPPIQRKYSNFYMQTKTNQQEKQKKELPPVAKFGRAVKCADYFARGGAGGGFADSERAAWAAERYYKDQDLAKQFKGMSVTQPSSAGVLVPQDTLDDVAPMLYDNTVLFELGAQRVPMPHGNLNIPRQTSGARAHFGGEARKIGVSRPLFDVLHLSAKRLQALVIMTEEIMRSTDVSADTLFGNDLLMQMRLGVEWGGLVSPGTQYTPLSLMANPKVEEVNLLTLNDTQLTDAQGHPTADLPIFIRGKVLKKNVNGPSFGWTFNADAEQYLKRMKYPGTGEFVWKDEMDKGTFNGDAYRVTNLIPTSPTGYTSMVFGNWSDFLVGEQFGLETRTTYDATVQTDNGDVNTFQTVQTATRATTYIDMGNRHDESFVKVTNVKVIG